MRCIKETNERETLMRSIKEKHKYANLADVTKVQINFISKMSTHLIKYLYIKYISG